MPVLEAVLLGWESALQTVRVSIDSKSIQLRSEPSAIHDEGTGWSTPAARTWARDCGSSYCVPPPSEYVAGAVLPDATDHVAGRTDRRPHA